MFNSRFSILFACGAAATSFTACATDSGSADDQAIDNAGTGGAIDQGQPTTDSGAIGAAASTLPECKAQRAVYIVGGNAGFAWFSLVWPLPAVINNFQPTYAYDDPTLTKSVSGDATHPLLARKVPGTTRAVWQGLGTSPYPSAFIAGANETHTNTPATIVNSATAGNLLGQAAALQTTIPSTIPVLTFGTAGPYTAVAGAPLAVNVANLDAAIAAFTGKLTAAQIASLRPTADQQARYIPAGAGAATTEVDFGNQLAFAANAFKLGVVNTIVIPAFRDDPHGAFASGQAGPRADHISAALDAFYTDLAAANEPSCSHTAKTLTLADNVVTMVDGDTPKNSFNNAGWPDGTIGNSNWIYVRSNGFTKPGWFGDITATTRTTFDPATGALSTTATAADDTAAAWGAALYAVARGDKPRVQQVTSAQFDGLIK